MSHHAIAELGVVLWVVAAGLVGWLAWHLVAAVTKPRRRQ